MLDEHFRSSNRLARLLVPAVVFAPRRHMTDAHASPHLERDYSPLEPGDSNFGNAGIGP